MLTSHFLLAIIVFTCIVCLPELTNANPTEPELPRIVVKDETTQRELSSIAPQSSQRELPPPATRIEILPAEAETAQQRVQELYWDKRYGEALPLAQALVEFERKTRGEAHLDFATSLIRVADIYRARAEGRIALRWYEQALRIQENNDDIKELEIVTTLISIADLHHVLGSIDQSLSYYERADALFESALAEEKKVLSSANAGTEAPFLAPIPFDAASLAERGAIQEALSQYATEFSLGAGELISVGKENIRLGNLEKAWELYLHGASMYETTSRSRDLMTISGGRLKELARLFQSKGETNRAIAIFRHASSVEEQSISDTVWSSVRDMSLEQLRLGRNPIEWLSNHDAFSGSTGYLISEGLAANRSTNTFISLHTQQAPTNQAAARLALTTILRRKGRVLESISNSAQQLRKQFTEIDQAILDEVNDIIDITADLYEIARVAGPESYSAEQQEQLRQAIARAEALDNILQCRSGLTSSSAQFKSNFVSIEQVQQAIPEDGALIDFFLYNPVDLGVEFQQTSPSHYVAYVITKEGGIYGVDLGEADIINQKAANFQLMLSERANSREVAQQLYEDLLLPILPLIGDKEHLLISPDSLLSNIPFAALVDEQNKYLLESYQLSYFSASRDLLRIQPNSPNLGGVIVYANPDYDRSIEPNLITNEASNMTDMSLASRERLIRSAAEECQIRETDTLIGSQRLRPPIAVAPRVSQSEARRQTTAGDHERKSRIYIGNSRIVLQPGWMDDITPPTVDTSAIAMAPLPGTAQEASAITRFLPEAVLFEQREASEVSLKQIKSPSILHIATHGFFLPEADFVSRRSTSRGGFVLEADISSAPSQYGSADYVGTMYRSGLALAGANNAEDTQDDGILTAIEASMLDLSGTQLVVLSACETGLGGISERDGIHGLRRAFTIAGTESQLISLWQVDDQGTKELMEFYYENLIEKGQGRSEALHNAQLTMLRSDYKDPFYWSAFLFSGDWSPMDRNELSPE